MSTALGQMRSVMEQKSGRRRFADIHGVGADEWEAELVKSGKQTAAQARRTKTVLLRRYGQAENAAEADSLLR